MSDDNFYSSMYGGSLYRDTKPVKPEPSAEQRQKMATRVAAGMKAQGAHTTTLDMGDGTSITVPRTEYVQQLENQLKDARNRVRDLETKQQRLIKANNRIMEKLRQIEQELSNKIDLRN